VVYLSSLTKLFLVLRREFLAGPLEEALYEPSTSSGNSKRSKSHRE
jgi:hypothetical protein